MRNLKRDQKIAWVTKAKELYTQHTLTKPGLYVTLSQAMTGTAWGKSPQEICMLLPEFVRHKPKDKGPCQYWWDIENRAIRIKVLDAILYELSQKETWRTKLRNF